jgi:dTDP-3-amino-3,4,6-trideoxy-alpha-D-glucose transaminase
VSIRRIPFIDLTPAEDDVSVRAAIARVIDRGWFVLGPEVEAFEAEFALASGARYAIGVANGTDALALILRSLYLAPGAEVIVPAITAAYTGLAVIMAGGCPVFADVSDDTLTIDPRSAASLVTSRTAAIVPVHLYGHPADMAAVRVLAERHRLAVVEDCCQAHLATAGGLPVGTIGVAGAFSFYPTKNLGAMGDGGAVVTNDATVADRIRRLRNGGQADRYHHEEAGVNSRLDEMQAAVLRARLPRLRDWTARRRQLAEAYRAALSAALLLPERDTGHVYHLFPVRSATRDALQAHLKSAGIETLIHYPVPLSRQRAFTPFEPADTPVAARATREILSLPMHPRLAVEDVTMVAGAVAAFEKGRAFA